MTRFWERYPSWKEAEEAWEKKAQAYRTSTPLKTPARSPRIPGITEKTKKLLKLKTLKYLLTHDRERLFRRFFCKRPIHYTFAYLRSILKRKPIRQEGDFYFFGFKDAAAFQATKDDPNSLLIVGFSFCQKPLECPDGRFNPSCRFDPDHPVCRQCFIGKVRNALPEERTLSVIIPTVYDIGRTLFETIERFPQKKIVFLITACDLSLAMFADFGQMTGVPGVGIRLSGRICNTLKAFTLAERGTKPGLTYLSPETEKRVLEFLKK